MIKLFQLLILKLFRFKILLSVFFIFLSAPLKAENNTYPCFKNNISSNSKSNEFSLAYKILVEVNKNKKFQINNLKILKSTNLINKKFKKRYSGKVKVFYKDKICVFKANIRIHGDFKDHIKLVKGNVNQSLDIHLKDGNINGITKFKLFLPETRKQW